jgi:ribonuclease BN (tRNA processing enzyme)
MNPGVMHALRFAALCAVGIVVSAASASAQTCGAQGVALQILGSGGPIPSSSASSGYLVWRDGLSVALVDAGGGVFHSFGRARGKLEQLEIVALSHLHADHVSDLPALLWLSDYRRDPLPIAGPSGNALAPSFDVFLERLIGEKDSAFPLVRARGAALGATVVDASRAEPTVVHQSEGLQVTALGVPHGVPALAYRMTLGGTTIVFGGDQNGTNPAFIEFAKGADLLVAHLSLSMRAKEPQLTSIHATPDIIGQIAAKAGVRGLALSHIIEPRREEPLAASFSGFDADTVRASAAEVRKYYGGTIVVAQDLQCLGFGGGAK